MSHDSWGGGSDADPKMRVRELDAIRREKVRRMLAPMMKKPKPRVSLLDGILILIAVIAGIVVVAASMHH